MLVLSRSGGESVVLKTSDGDVIVTVADVRPGKVRLGFTAPRSVSIARVELTSEEDQGRFRRMLLGR